MIVAVLLPTAHALLLALRPVRTPTSLSTDTALRRAIPAAALFNRAPIGRGCWDIFEQTQILQIDHSFNASTFTARVVTSTLAPPASALSAAMGSLDGPLHGAADQGALEMAEEVGDPRQSRGVRGNSASPPADW